MKRILSIAMVCLTVFAFSVGNASAQGGPGGGRFGGRFGQGMMGQGGGLMMLRMEEVQKELKLTPEQIAELQTKQEDMREQMGPMMQQMQGASPDERQKIMAQMQAAQKTIVDAVLNDEQKKRFRELELQQMGPAAILARKDVADELKVTAEQKKQMEAAQRSAMQEMRSSLQGQNPREMSDEDRQKFMTKMQDMQKASQEKVLAVLSEDQRKQWKEMQGAPFTFPARRGFGGGFGGGRRGQGGNN